MKKSFYALYRLDLIALGFLLLDFADKFSDSNYVLPVAIGALLGFIPRIISISSGISGSTDAERKRSLIFFCCYLFLGLWMTDFPSSEAGSAMTTVLFTAGLYHIIFYGVSLWFKEKEKEIPVSIRTRQLGFAIAALGIAYFIYRFITTPTFSSEWMFSLLFLALGVVGSITVFIKRSQIRRM